MRFRRLRALVALALLFSLMLQPATAKATATHAAPYPGYWHTSGTRILDAHGNLVRIAGVTWSGMASSHWVPTGLDFQRYTTIMDLIKLLGYNTVRLPFSNELVERNPVVRDGVAANPQFRGKRAMQVMDAVVAYARQIGLKIILDDHRSRAARPREVNSLYEPLWYDRQYPESSWIRDWQALARRYRGNDAVVGFDLRNEPHTDGPGPWTVSAYLHHGATWGPYHGVDNPATDWRLAAQRAGNTVLGINPHLLIIVQGLSLYPDASQPGGVASSWWAGILTPVKKYPVALNVPHQLVYSVHDWGPRKQAMPWFKNLSYGSLEAAWHRNWSFLLDRPAAGYAAPIWLGEFGTCNESSLCVEGQRGDSQGHWFQLVLRFLREHSAVGWSFFSLDGTNSNNCRTDNGLLNARWNTVSNLALQRNLRSVQAVLGLMPTTPGKALLPGTSTTRKPRSPRSPLCQLP
jgi:endoglucanase